MFNLSARSLKVIETVKPTLADCVGRAIQLTEVDFVAIEGRRTLKRQQELVAAGASKTMDSRHLTGDAVDLAAWLGTIRWEMPLYFKIADAMKAAAAKQGLAIRWGGSWTTKNFTEYKGTAEQAYHEYLVDRKAKGLSPFIDGPHFELV